MGNQKHEMISFEEAFSRVMAHTWRIEETEKVSLDRSVGRVLAEDVVADRDIPPFNRVAVDGFAMKRGDLGKEIKLKGMLKAGDPASDKVEQGKCIKVMTGSPLPEGAEVVVMVEHAKEDGDLITTPDRPDYLSNFALKGEDLHEGQRVLLKGTVIGHRHIATLASLGCGDPVVRRKPVVGILTTGDEVVEPGDDVEPHQIRNANGPTLQTLLERTGAESRYYGIVGDDMPVMEEVFRKAEAECDLVLLSGGVSMGTFDLVPDLLIRFGYKPLFRKVAIKPGKPFTFAVSENRTCFALPGNPVSVFVTFELFIAPFLQKCMGAIENPGTVKSIFSRTFKRGKIERDEWIPVKLVPEGVEPVSYHGSGHYSSLSEAFGLVRIHRGIDTIEEGEPVDVRPI